MRDTSNDLIIRSLYRQPIPRTPVWLMRQAGRYLPEYRRLRQTMRNFMDFCKEPELSAAVTLQPLERFPLLDAAIIFSDILTLPDAFGLRVEMQPSVGPVIHPAIRHIADLKKLQALPTEAVIERLQYVFQAISLVKPALKKPLIGFAGSPWTVACYMIEGGSSKTFHHTRARLYQAPSLVSGLLQLLTEVTIEYLKHQIQAGADIIILFDTWGGLLTPQAYQQFSLCYLSQIAQAIKAHSPSVPVIFFSKNTGLQLEAIARSGCDAIALDWTIDIGEARTRCEDRVALQGNLDPAMLFTDPQTTQAAVHGILNTFGRGTGHIFNLGHGIMPHTPIENVQAMLEAVHNHPSGSAAP